LQYILVAEFTEPEIVEIVQLNDHLGRTVVINGAVTSTHYTENANFIDVSDQTGDITVVVFEPLQELPQGTQLRITGKPELYKGELEIIAREITHQ